MTPAEKAAVLAASGATTKEVSTTGNSELFIDVVTSLGAQWAMKPFHVPKSHLLTDEQAIWPLPRHRGEHQLVSPTFFEEGDIFTETLERDADPDEYEEEEQEWVEETDAYDDGNGDEWDEDFPQDVDMEERSGSLETAEHEVSWTPGNWWLK